MKTLQLLVLALTILSLTSCEGGFGSGIREPQDLLSVDPEFDSSHLVDIAVLEPPVPFPDQWIGTAIRTSARRHLIDGKRYSVPSIPFVDGVVGPPQEAPSPEHLLEPLKTDAALVFALEQWESTELMGRGRCYGGGRALIYTRDGVAWERQFRDWPVLAPVEVTPSNREEVEADMLMALVREVLGPLPPKPLR